MELKDKMKFSLLFITHNLGIAKKIADRIIVMYRASIVESADKYGLFKMPKHQHTKDLIRAYEKIGVL